MLLSIDGKSVLPTGSDPTFAEQPAPVPAALANPQHPSSQGGEGLQ